MNTNQIMNMIIRTVMRRVINTGINAGVNAASSIGKRGDTGNGQAAPDDSPGVKTAKDRDPHASGGESAKRIRQMAKLTRRMTRF